MKQKYNHEIQIEPANETHLSEIASLAALIWRAHYPGIISRKQIDYMLGQMYSLETLGRELQAGVRYRRLLAGEEFLGFAAFGPTEHADVFKLHKLYLHPDQHGRGLGSRLLRHCEDEVRQLGARRLVLTVNKRNAGAIATYQKNGFGIVDSVVTDIGGGFVMDDYVMSRELSP